MEPRISIVTLGVTDMVRMRKFYTDLGFVVGDANDNVTFFQAGGMILSLYGRKALAEDARVADSTPGFSGISLAHNVRSENDVDSVLAHAVTCGAKLLKPGQKVFWGGYSGYFADPEGNLWEVAHNPFFPLDAQGNIKLP
jgi:uncharacterized protein